MIESKKVLAIIPARGGSKGIPRKNITDLGGKPLIAWTIEAAKKSKFIDRLILSSEDREIQDVASRFGCEVPFTRPAELSRDETSGTDPVLHALGELPGYDYVVLLQPTSPFRSPKDIDAALEKCVNEKAPACISVCEVSENPFWMFFLDAKGGLKRVLDKAPMATRRQDLPKSYIVNGAVYVAETGFLMERKEFFTDQTLGYVMPSDRSIDIDSPEDLALCKYRLDQRSREPG